MPEAAGVSNGALVMLVVCSASLTFDDQDRGMSGLLKEPGAMAERKTSQFRCPYVALTHQPIFTQTETVDRGSIERASPRISALTVTCKAPVWRLSALN